MFGYVKPRPSELLVKEYDFYRAAYCGVCRGMKKETGFFSSFFLSYDMVFLALVRMLDTDRAVCCHHRRCIAHPLRRRPCLQKNEALSYAARVSAVLIAEKLRDDRRDGSFLSRVAASLPLLLVFRRAEKRARLSFLSEQIARSLSELNEMEKERVPSIDRPAALFGDLLGLVFSEGASEENAPLFYDVGYHLGVFIYAADAADDYRDDKKSGSYNPYVLLYPPEGFDCGIPDEVKASLRVTLTALGNAVEKLPFHGDRAVENIIKNTVYYGLPDRIERLGRPRTKKDERKASKAPNGGKP